VRSTELARSSYIKTDVTSVASDEEIPVKCTIMIVFEAWMTGIAQDKEFHASLCWIV
jgi:hypothetical protein